MATDGYIIAGVALLGICFTLLASNKKFLADPIEKTNDQIIMVLEKINENSSEISPLIDDICTLQRKKSHLHKDIQNTISLLFVISLSLIIISLESAYFETNPPLRNTTTQFLILFVGVLSILAFGFILRFSIEIGRINEIALTEDV